MSELATTPMHYSRFLNQQLDVLERMLDPLPARPSIPATPPLSLRPRASVTQDLSEFALRQTLPAPPGTSVAPGPALLHHVAERLLRVQGGDAAGMSDAADSGPDMPAATPPLTAPDAISSKLREDVHPLLLRRRSGLRRPDTPTDAYGLADPTLVPAEEASAPARITPRRSSGMQRKPVSVETAKAASDDSSDDPPSPTFIRLNLPDARAAGSALSELEDIMADALERAQREAGIDRR